MSTIENPNLAGLTAFLNFLAGGGTTIDQVQAFPQLAALLQAIPYANDGDVILPEHHNTLRAAIGQIARGLDETAFARVTTKGFAPVLLPDPNIASGAWRAGLGGALGPDPDELELTGWMPLDLPQGTDVDTLVVRGITVDDLDFWSVALRRVEPASGDSVDLCNQEIQEIANDKNRPFVARVPFTSGELTPAAASELRRVDNDKYRYVFYTTLNDARKTDRVEIHSVQVTCTRG